MKTLMMLMIVIVMASCKGGAGAGAVTGADANSPSNNSTTSNGSNNSNPVGGVDTVLHTTTDTEIQTAIGIYNTWLHDVYVGATTYQNSFNTTYWNAYITDPFYTSTSFVQRFTQLPTTEVTTLGAIPINFTTITTNADTWGLICRSYPDGTKEALIDSNRFDVLLNSKISGLTYDVGYTGYTYSTVRQRVLFMYILRAYKKCYKGITDNSQILWTINNASSVNYIYYKLSIASNDALPTTTNTVNGFTTSTAYHGGFNLGNYLSDDNATYNMTRSFKRDSMARLGYELYGYSWPIIANTAYQLYGASPLSAVGAWTSPYFPNI